MNLSGKITSYQDEIAVNNYEYDGENVTAIYNNGYKYGFSYDEENRLEEVKLNDISLVTYAYGEDSGQVSYANGSYRIRNTTGDSVEVDAGEKGSYIYEYNAEENCETCEFPDSGLVLTYFYDENEELTRVETNTDFEIVYDRREGENNYTTDINYTIGQQEYHQVDIVEYEEETGKVITSVLLTGAEVSKYCDAENALYEKLTIGDYEYINKFQYGESSEIETITYDDGSRMEYTYDSKGNAVTVAEDGTAVSEYQYDSLDRMTSEIDYRNGTITYWTYDLCDNIQSSETYAYAGQEKGELLSSNTYVYSDTYGDQLVWFNGNSITYDESGKPLTYYNGSEFTWNGDRLVKAIVGEKEIEFFTDQNGTVVKKTVDGIDTEYAVEGNDYIAETTDGKTIFYLYDSQANPVGFTYDGNAYYYVKNAKQDIIKIVDSDYEFVCSYRYDAWGNMTAMEGNREIAELNKFRYRSYYYDSDLDMYYLHSRYYDSMTGRFISTDQIKMMVYNENNLNLYAYCKNNPVRYVDPEGTVATVKIFYLSEMETDASKVEHDFNYYYGSSNVKITTFKSSNFDNYETEWNNLGATGVVVMVTHAKPSLLHRGDPDSPNDCDRLTVLEINGLDYKNITVLILLGCNAGHYDYKSMNVANAFSKRISGCVVASDGTVHVNLSGITALFSSIADVEFSKYTSRKTNYGWIVYKYGRASMTVKYEKIGITTMRLDNLMVYLSENRFFLTYK